MIDLSTTYLGLKLKNPLVASASPLSKKVEQAKRMEEAGIAAVVMYSLFEEQIIHESLELDHYLTRGTESIFLMPAPTACCPIATWRMWKS
jgi:dihydroorotate dehydrogenase (fumarate)